MGSEGKHSKDPPTADCGVARWFIQVEIKAAPWVSSVPSLSAPPWRKSNCVLSKAKTIANIQNFCFVLKLSPVQQLASLACVPGYNPLLLRHSSCHLEPVCGADLAHGHAAAKATRRWREKV